MEKQIPMFPEPPPDENDAITARINARRKEDADRAATRPGHQHRLRRKPSHDGTARLYCPSCGESLTIRLAKAAT